MFEWLRERFVNAIAIQFCRAQPHKFSWFFVKYMMMGRDKFLTHAAVKLACVEPDSRVLCIGVRKGYGVRKIFETIERGNGKVFAIERSRERAKRAVRFCSLECSQNKAEIYSGHPWILPFPSNFFDSALHSDEYYFWRNQSACLREIYRVLKPGATMVCTLDVDWLRDAQRRGFLQCGDADPLDYMLNAELAGFQDVRFEYFSTNEPKRIFGPGPNFQAILMTKPPVEPPAYYTDEDVEEAERELYEMFYRREVFKQAQKINPPVTKYSYIDSQ